ncbi:MAG TPA: HPP family protein [Halococcus sp.]|nr:HPP family protein [Halococcus sp.]
MSRQILFTSIYTGVLLLPLGIIAWLTGRPFLFPSIGPSAFLMAMILSGEPTSARRVVGGHIIGTLAGLFAYHLFAPGITILAPTVPLAGAPLQLTASTICALMLTVAGMLYTETVHPPACATTLIIALGLLSSIEGAITIIGSIVVLFTIHTLVIRYVIPVWSDEME